MAIERSRIAAMLIALLILLFTGTIASYALEPPMLPHVFYGNLTLNNSPASHGSIVTVGQSTNFLCGSFSVVNQGRFGILSCSANNPALPGVQGATPGAGISFFWNSTRLWILTSQTTYVESMPFEPGSISYLHIRTPAVCGDGYCDPHFEMCDICIFDCGICKGSEDDFLSNLSPEDLANLTQPGGGGIGTPGAPGPTPPPPPPSPGDSSYQYCVESWVCTQWEPEICPITGEQLRNCVDMNSCNTFYTMPATKRECEYIPTCFDSILNGLESDVDCGGPECQKCTAGKMCRTNDDCVTLSCDPENLVCLPATCEDGIQNQGELGIDCGGPCPPCEVRRPVIDAPAVIVEELSECGIYPWNFIALSMLGMLLFIIIRQVILMIIYKRMDDEFEKKIHYRMSYNRTTWWIAATILLLTIAVSFYVRIVCSFAGAWAIALLFILISIVSYTIRSYLVYDEKRAELRFLAHLQGHSLRTEKIFFVIEFELKDLMKRILLEARSEETLRKNDLLVDIAKLGLNMVLFKNERKMLLEMEQNIGKTSDLIELARMKQDITFHAKERDRLLSTLSSDLSKLIEKVDNNEYDMNDIPEDIRAKMNDVIGGLRAYNDAITTELESRRENN
jgi:hypothetical protein